MRHVDLLCNMPFQKRCTWPARLRGLPAVSLVAVELRPGRQPLAQTHDRATSVHASLVISFIILVIAV